MELIIAGTRTILLPQKAMLLPDRGILIIADVHLGKAMHFRKSGIFMPAAGAARDYLALNNLIATYKPQSVWFLGDLFHSLHNSEWLQFEDFIRQWPQVAFTLIRGNHDIIKKDYYDALGIVLVPEQIQIDNLVFSHEPLKEVGEGQVNIAGHIHPGYLVRGRGRQSFRFPCFYFRDNCLLLPAFGYFTGLAMMDGRNAQVFTILEDKVVQL